MKQKLKYLKSIIIVYFTIMSTLSFNNFILEESIQMLSFANFNCRETGLEVQYKKNIDLMSDITNVLEVSNYFLRFLNPISAIGYDNYIAGTREYIETHRLVILNRKPELFIDEEILLSFIPDSYEYIDGIKYCKYRQIRYKEGQRRGRLLKSNGRLIVE